MKKLILILLLIPNLVIGEGGGYVPGQSMKEYFESSDLPPLEDPESWKERQREYKVYQDEQQRLREKKQRDITSKSYINSIKRECQLLGFSPNSAEFKNCVMELM